MAKQEESDQPMNSRELAAEVSQVVRTEPGAAPELSRLVQENITALLSLREKAERKINSHQRFIEAVSAFAGQPRFFYSILVFVGLWLISNWVLIFSGRQAFDPPPFFWLQGMVSLSALLMTVVVLTAQSRQGKIAEQDAQLDLQINLVAEQKIAKLIGLLEELRRDLPIVKNRHDPEAEAMQTSADPHSMAKAIEHQKKDSPYLRKSPG